MIGYLKGTARGTNIVVTDGGVGYVVHTPGVLVDGADVELIVTTIVREDAITLFGFATAAERDCFDALRKVTGVGPTTALNLVRDVGVAAIAGAVAAGDPKPLCAAAGVGKKAAEKILAMVNLDAVEVDLDGPRPRSELVTSIAQMGFDEDKVADAVAAAVDELGVDAPEGDLLVVALAQLRAAA